MSEFYDNDERNGRIPIYKEFMSIRKVKRSRKEFRCESCGGKIKRGDSCQYWAGVTLGEFYQLRICDNCCSDEPLYN
jgi:hypothetical protein